MKPPIGYTRRTLIPGEHIVYAAKLHWFSYFFPFFLLAVGCVMMALPFLIEHVSEMEEVKNMTANSNYSEFGTKMSEHWSSVSEHIPPSVMKFLEDANELRQFVIGFIFLFFGTVYFLATFIKKISTEQAVTNKKIIYKKGFIKIDETEISLSNVEGIKVVQSAFNRMIKRGDVLVNGVGMEQILLKGISHPNRFRHYAYSEWDKYHGHHNQHMQQPMPPQAPPPPPAGGMPPPGMPPQN